MEQVLLSPISLSELRNTIGEIIRNELINKEKIDLHEKLLSPAQTCQLFQPVVSKVTLSKWTKDGHLNEHRIGGRVYYKYSEVMDSLKTLRKYKRVLS